MLSHSGYASSCSQKCSEPWQRGIRSTRSFSQKATYAIACYCILAVCFANDSLAAQRVALVFGNASYADAELNLSNPGNDAQALARQLTTMGFQVDLQIDQAVSEMNLAIEAFGRAAHGADMAVFFYAGHGLQIDNENHLLATDFGERTLEELQNRSVQLGRVRKLMADAKPEIGVMVIDACRDNPFAALGKVERGLAYAPGGAGVLVAYATDPGNIAYDGAGNNSVFTEALLKHMATPGLDVRLMFGRVRQDVILSTGGLQVPWVEESVVGEHSFNQAAPEPVTEPETATDIARWRDISVADEAGQYLAYLDEFPQGLFRDFANQRLDTLRAGISENSPVPSTTQLDPFLVAMKGDDRALLKKSLAMLGLLPKNAADADPHKIITRGISLYEAQAPSDNKLTPESLYDDAARTVALYGASVARQLRTDLVALYSVEKTLRIAEEAFAELTEIAGSDREAQPLLDQAGNDIAVIRQRREEVLAQLDASREYYKELIQTGRLHYRGRILRLSQTVGSASRQVSERGVALQADVGVFVRHVQMPVSDIENGSFKWLKDFLPAS